MELVCLTASSFRNLAQSEVCLNPRLNLVIGDNGEGKSNLLEAVVMLGNLRSFRASSLRPVPAHGSKMFHLEGKLRDRSGSWQLAQQVDVGPPVVRRLTLNGAPVATAEYLRVFPVFAISSEDRELVAGPPAARRSFLDHFTFLLQPPLFAELRSYRNLLKQRNAILAREATVTELQAWETQLAAAAARVVCRRTRAVRRLRARFDEVYAALRSSGFPDVTLSYRGDGVDQEEQDEAGLVELYETRYSETRARDRELGFTSIGPHRHDLRVRASRRLARDVLSAGQTKVVASALRLAALEQVEEERGERLAVVVDDIDAELDSRVLSRLVGHLGAERQLFLSSAHEAMVAPPIIGGTTLRMHRGSCTSPGACGENDT